MCRVLEMPKNLDSRSIHLVEMVGFTSLLLYKTSKENFPKIKNNHKNAITIHSSQWKSNQDIKYLALAK